MTHKSFKLEFIIHQLIYYYYFFLNLGSKMTIKINSVFEIFVNLKLKAVV